MQLSKENSDAGGATGASARPPAAAHPPLCLGQRGPGAYSPARPPRRKHSPTGTRAGAPHFAARLPSHLLWDLRGRGARTATARSQPAGRKARDTTGPGRAAPLPFPRRDPVPWEKRGCAPTWPRRASVTGAGAGELDPLLPPRAPAGCF